MKLNNEMIRGKDTRSIPAFPLLHPDDVGSSSTTIDVTGVNMITFDSETTIQLNGTGETFTAGAGSRWTIGSSVTSITVGSATKYILA